MAIEINPLNSGEIGQNSVFQIETVIWKLHVQKS